MLAAVMFGPMESEFPLECNNIGLEEGTDGLPT